MGIKKLSKRLVRMGRKASKGTGKDAKKWVEAVFETAIGVIEERIQKRGAKRGKTPKTSPGRGSRQPVASGGRKTPAAPRKPVARVSVKRVRPSRRHRPAPAEQPRAAAADVAPAVPNTHARASGPYGRGDPSST